MQGTEPENNTKSSGGGAGSELALGGMKNLMSEWEDHYRPIRRGDTVEGTIVRADRDGYLVDLGTKSEGLIPMAEAQRSDAEGSLKVGDQVLVYVIRPAGREGHALLSLDKALSERGWRLAQQRYEQKESIEASVVDHNKGGLIVNVDGVLGFVPMSQVVGLGPLYLSTDNQRETKLASMIGQKIVVKVLEIDRRRNRLILSERMALQEQRTLRRDQLLEELREGEVRRGQVTSLCDFGAFVDIGGIEGLAHLSELSWRRISHPSEVVKVGDIVDAYVLALDREKKRVALSLKRTQPEPWAELAQKYTPGDLVRVTITKLANFGAFARVEDGLEGLIHISELSDVPVAHPKNVVREGDVVTARITRIEPERHRISLSLRGVSQDSTEGAEEG